MPLGVLTDPAIDVKCLEALWTGAQPSRIAADLGLPTSTQVCRNAGREALRRLKARQAPPDGPGPLITEHGAIGKGPRRCDASKGDEALEMKLAGETLTVICHELGWQHEGAASTAISRAAIRRLSTVNEE